MNKQPLEQYKDNPKNWNDILGPFFRKSDLPTPAFGDEKLIILKSSDKTEVCPQFQFEINDQGVLVMSSHIATAWELLSALQISQLNENAWTSAGRLVQSRPEHNNQSWSEVLKNPETDKQTRTTVYAAIINDALYAARVQGITLIEPMKMQDEQPDVSETLSPGRSH